VALISDLGRPGLTRRGRRLRRIRRWIVIAVVLLLLGLGVAAGLKVYQYSAAPPGEKDCAANPRFAGPPIAPGLQVVEPPVRLQQKGGTINDASCLNRTPVYGIAKPANEDELRTLIAFARDNGLKVSIAGARHSMGGQAFFTNALVLNTGNLKEMSLDETDQLLTVQSGASWHDVLAYLHPRGFSVKVMQAIDLPTVGGSIAVNGHGVDHRAGSLASTVRSLRVMLADGSVHQVSREHEPELFASVIGGYGLFGIVLDAQLEVVPDAMYRYEQQTIDYRQFPQLFAQTLSRDPYRLTFGHLSTAPGSFLKEMLIYSYQDAGGYSDAIPALKDSSQVGPTRFFLNFAKMGAIGQELKWFAEKRIMPLFRPCYVPRNQALQAETCLISRNQALYGSLGALKTNLPADTEILQEYFVPQDRFVPFIDSARQVLEQHHAIVLNASVRVVHRGNIRLDYADGDKFSLVLFIDQKVTPEGDRRMRALTQAMIDATAQQGGTFYLPYQLDYRADQLQRAYPTVNAFFGLKRAYDPGQLFTNEFYATYGRNG
jgi:FAD/FMN-containing dehydrogenase